MPRTSFLELVGRVCGIRLRLLIELLLLPPTLSLPNPGVELIGVFIIITHAHEPLLTQVLVHLTITPYSKKQLNRYIYDN